LYIINILLFRKLKNRLSTMRSLILAVVTLLYIPTLSVGQLDLGLGEILGGVMEAGTGVVKAVHGIPIVGEVVDVACDVAFTGLKVVVKPVLETVSNSLETFFKTLLKIHDSICKPIFKVRDNFLSGKYDTRLKLLSILNPLIVLPTFSDFVGTSIHTLASVVDVVVTAQKAIPIKIKLQCKKGKLKGRCENGLNVLQCEITFLVNSLPKLVKAFHGALKRFGKEFVALSNYSKTFKRSKATVTYIKNFVATFFKIHDGFHKVLNILVFIATYTLKKLAKDIDNL